MLLRASLPILAFALIACTRPQVLIRRADGQTRNVQSATPAEYTEAVESGRASPLPAKTSAAASAITELPWIADDATAAMALAKAKNLPVFVDVWATWCHSCVHMREFVLKDSVVRALADKAVWLSVDADKPSNAAFLASAKVSAYPTLMVLAADGAERSRWAGTMDADQVARFLAGGKVVDDALAAVFKKAESGDNAGCVLQGEKLVGSYEKLGRMWDELALGATILGCAREVGESRCNLDERGVCATNVHWWRLSDVAQVALGKPQPELLAHADDISSAMEMLVDAPGLIDEATPSLRATLANQWRLFLESMSTLASTRAERSAFDAHRVLACLAVKTPEKAIPMLEKTRKDFPRDFNAPARLAKVYLAMKDYPKARAEAAAALALVDGPRTVRIVSLASDIEKAAGDVRAERRQLESGIARCKKLWLPPTSEKLLAELENRLSKLTSR